MSPTTPNAGQDSPGGASPFLTAFLENQPTAVERILTEHLDNGRGDCRKCTDVARGTSLTWPCSTYTAAQAARALHTRGTTR